MIQAVKANDGRFKPLVGIKPGLNLVIANRHEQSSERQSRNGAGKSSLIDIIHYVLGGDLISETLKSSYLSNWEFSLDMQLDGRQIIASRRVSSNKIILGGEVQDWNHLAEVGQANIDGGIEISKEEWNKILGQLCFNLPKEPETQSPTFRSLIQFFIRNGQEAYNSPFETFKQEKVWQKQVYNTYLLDLGWEYARELSQKKEQEKKTADLIKGIKEVNKESATQGKLEAERIILEGKIGRLEANLRNFRVLPQYEITQKEADNITVEISNINQSLFHNNQLLLMYETDNDNIPAIDGKLFDRLYASATVEIPEMVKKRYEDAAFFHQEVIQNRKRFLKSEIDRLTSLILKSKSDLEQLDAKRAELLNILATHKALDDYNRLQNELSLLKTSLGEILYKLNHLKEYEERKSRITIELENLKESADKDYQERKTNREEAIRQFNLYSEVLHEAPGQLIIDLNNNGYKFDIQIQGGRSDGRNKIMKTFCYDLTLAYLWSKKKVSPRILIHDSLMFDGVDSRQIGKAIELVHQEAVTHGYRYIMTLNSDDLHKVTTEYDLQKLNIQDYIRLELDDTDTGGLFGCKF